jgi:uncharacterized protein
MDILLALGIVIGATAIILNLSRVAATSPVAVSDLEYINTQSTYQSCLLAVALAVLVVLYFINGANFSIFLAPGNIDSPATGVPWLGISEGESWLGLGAGLSLFITLATSLVVYLQFRKSGGDLRQVIPFFPWILLCSVMNSFSEEVVYRLGVIVPLVGSIDTAYILLISAAAFGAPHLRGMPNGAVGALMAALLGWLLAKSVVETNGIFWAWWIHFLQDIVIFSAFVMAAVNKSFNRTRGADARLAG